MNKRQSGYQIITFAEVPNGKSAQNVANEIAGLFIRNPKFKEDDLAMTFENAAMSLEEPSQLEVVTIKDPLEGVATLNGKNALVVLTKGDTIIMAQNEGSFVVFNIGTQTVAFTDAPEFDVFPLLNGDVQSVYLLQEQTKPAPPPPKDETAVKRRKKQPPPPPVEQPVTEMLESK